MAMHTIGRAMGRQRIGVALVFALVLAGLVTVGHATTSPPDVAVSISGFAFHGPNDATAFTVLVGTQVTWTNNDSFTHTTTSDAIPVPVWNSGSLANGATFSFTFNQVGVFPYHCMIHPSMHGTIAVVAPPNPTSASPAAGPSTGGTNVTITGTDFQSGAGVSFGGVAATAVNFVNATTITATTPAHAAGTFDIVVTNPDTSTGTLSPGFTFVVINPLPVLRPSGPPISGAIPLPAPRPSGAPDPGSPAALPGGRPPGNASVSGASGPSAAGANAPQPAPAPIPTGR